MNQNAANSKRRILLCAFLLLVAFIMPMKAFAGSSSAITALMASDVLAGHSSNDKHDDHQSAKKSSEAEPKSLGRSDPFAQIIPNLSTMMNICATIIAIGGLFSAAISICSGNYRSAVLGLILIGIGWSWPEVFQTISQLTVAPAESTASLHAGRLASSAAQAAHQVKHSGTESSGNLSGLFFELSVILVILFGFALFLQSRSSSNDEEEDNESPAQDFRAVRNLSESQGSSRSESVIDLSKDRALVSMRKEPKGRRRVLLDKPTPASHWDLRKISAGRVEKK